MAQEAPGAEHTPYETLYGLLGREGLQLTKALDQLTVQELSRMANLYHVGGDLTSRPGQGSAAYAQTGAGVPIHSQRRLNDPANTTYTRFVGAGAKVFRGQSGVLAQIDTGYSGDPLTFVTARPPQSGEPWMVLADRSRMRKFSRTSVGLPLGLPVPAAPTVTVPAGKSKRIIEFDASDGSNATSWTGSGLGDNVGVGVGAAPVLSDIPGAPNSINLTGVNVATQVGTATTGYGTVIRMAFPIDVSKFTDASDISDEDILHLALRMDDPSKVEEIRLYFVTSVFSLGTPLPVIPGTYAGVGVSPVNYAAYMHAYRPSDYAQFVAYEATAESAKQAIRTSDLLKDYTDPLALPGDAISSASSPAAHTWVEFGVIGLPVRRGDFIKIGPAGQTGFTWANVTGVYITIQTTDATSVNVAFDDAFFTGGYSPDTSEPGSQKFDYRVTDIDPRTGVESNPSATLAETLWVDALRQRVSIAPVPASDPALHQGFYRRGAALTDNWRFLGENAANGAVFFDTLSDADLATAETVPDSNFQPVSTSTAAGVTVLAQPVPVIFGPLEDGTYLACGDPYRPGHLYASLPGQVDYWPSTGNFALEVCAPSEELMNGGVVSGQGLVFSRERGYAVHVNPLGGEGIAVQPTGIIPGMACRWGITFGPGGCYYVAKDGVRVTGGEASEYLSDQIRPLFQFDPNGGVAAVPVNGFYPVDFNTPAAIQLEIHNLELWFLYQDTQGTRQCLVYSLLYRYWRPYTFAKLPSNAFADSSTTGLRLLFGATDGNLYLHEGFSDVGTAIACSLRTGAWDLRDPREEKQLGDLTVDADLQGATLTLQTYVNDEVIANTAQTVVGLSGERKYLFDPFGTVPQHARTLSCNLSVTAPLTAAITLRRLGVSYLPNPPITINRPTAWERVSPSTEGYCYGCQIDCDTGGSDRTILVEYDLAGVIATAATLTVNADGRHKLWFSWPAVHAMAVRLRPTGDCEPWILFKTDWIASPEPPRIIGWDTNFEDLGDRYYTGLDLTCDTFGQAKTLAISVDQVVVSTQQVQTTGKTFVHLDLTPGRGHIFRFVATDLNPGLLYDHKWLAVPEPGEQANWNAGFTTWSSLSDKNLKGLIIEADTFGQDKSVRVEADGVLAVTVSPVNHNGRTVKNYTFPQVLGRVFRVIPSDANPSRPYTILPLFDEEPYALARWESQLQDFGMPLSGWGSILSWDICYRSPVACTLTVTFYNSLGILVQTLVHSLPATGGAKQKRFVPVAAANKGVLYKQVFTTDDGSAGLTLYREESRLRVAPWGSPEQVMVRSLGNDDLDMTRQMTSAVGAASRAGGGT